MRKIFFILLFTFTSIVSGQSFEVSSLVSNNQNVKIKGKVIDGSAENQPLAFASVEIKELGIIAQTDLDGFFSFSLIPGNYTLSYTFIGYKTKQVKNIKVSKNKVFNLPKVTLFSESPDLDTTTEQVRL